LRPTPPLPLSRETASAGPTKPASTVSFGEPIRSGYVLVKRDRLTNVTSLEHERWKRAHPKFCRKMGIE